MPMDINVDDILIMKKNHPAEVINGRFFELVPILNCVVKAVDTK